ncbi:AAA domain-containing protein [[Clostridium] fimetarium]|uniref:AAA domain-containing protein n=1 Tax=[Clostridium] fimetarium TaxID=99656 RepID=A0A1I0R0F3_9FIRM|nr:AAA domain-containing protein [[Clostridium] fimetarium]
MKNIKNENKMIILTHNNHFYLNVKYPFNRCYNKASFFRLVSIGEKTVINEIASSKEDFNTSYQALWKELIFLYDNESASEEMLLNPMRRIVETYTKFNTMDHNIFCEKVTGAMKLFNVNSHSIDDLESDLCGKSKIEIVNIFYQCFQENDAIEHFNSYWPEYSLVSMTEER